MRSETVKKAAAAMIRDEIQIEGGFDIYTEMIEQGFKRPCFFIDIDEGYVQKRLSGGVFFCSKLKIVFYPEIEADVNEALLNMGIRLLNVCKVIKIDDKKVRLLSGQYSAKEDRLTFLADVKLKIDEDEDIPLMLRLFKKEEIEYERSGK